MKKYLLIIILISSYSCKDENFDVQEKNEGKEIKSVNKDRVNDLAYKIGDLYKPEGMSIKGNRVGTNNELENYQITLTNSDLLDSDIENVEKHAQKLAIIYYKFLFEKVKLFNFEKIIIKIEHRNTKTNSFEYSEENINQLLDSK
jgi:hypothetical protein